MLLAVDIGNTNIVLGVFKGEELIQSWRLKTDRNKSADEYGMIINQLFAHEKMDTNEIEDIIISTVVPPVVHTLQHMATKYFNKKAIVVGPGIKTGMVIKYDNPKLIGTDRIVNSIAAFDKYGGPLIVVDFGTATTFSAISEKGEFLGGTIAAGLQISSDALFEKTAKLPKVELEAPGFTICRNTVASMQSGLLYGHMGLAKFIIEKMKKELGGQKKITVVATGGLSSIIADEIEIIDHIDKFLTLKGLRLIHERNK